MQNINNKVANSAKWSIITEVIARLISPIVNMILARLLLPEAFGAVATITMIISFAEIFTDAGFQKYIIQHEFKDDKDFDESVNVAFWSNFSFSSLLVLLIWIFKNKLAYLVGSPELSMGIAVASFSIIFVAFSSIQMAIYRRNFQFKTLFYIRMIVSMIPLVITVPLAIVLKNYWALVLGTLCMNFTQAVILTLKSKWKPRFFYSFEKFKEMFSFTSLTMLETVLTWLVAYVDTFIVGIALNDYYLGLYKTSMTTVNAYMNIIIAGIIPVLFSALSRCQNDDAEFENTYFRFQKNTAMFIIPMSIGIFIFKDLVVSILLGAKWVEASGFVGIWGLMSGFAIILINFTSEVYRSKGRPDIALFTQILHLLFLVPTLVISVNYGFEALYTARSLVRIQGMLTGIIIAQCIFKIKIIDTMKQVIPPILSSLVMGAVAFAIKGLFSAVVWQFVSIFICVVVYFSVLMIFPEFRKEIMSFVRSKIFKKR